MLVSGSTFVLLEVRFHSVTKVFTLTKISNRSVTVIAQQLPRLSCFVAVVNVESSTSPGRVLKYITANGAHVALVIEQAVVPIQALRGVTG